MTKVIIRPEAKQDLREAKAWYRKISPDLAADFVQQTDAAVARVRENPLAYPLVLRTFRRILLHRFPYSLFYHVGENQLIVVAILHQARDPAIIGSRHL